MTARERPIEPVLFTWDGRRDNAVVNFDSSHRMSPYATAYWLAAEAVTEKVLEEGVRQDYLVHPLLFLYRQAIELDLKHLIAEGRPLVRRGTGFPHGHDLEGLWQECKAILLRIDRSCKDEAALVGTIIIEFARVDPLGQSFRYPLDKEGRPSLPTELHLIDLRNVAAVMETVRNFLGAAGLMLQVTRERREEMEHAYTR